MSQKKFFEYVNRLIDHEKRNRASWAKTLSVTERTITNFNKRLENEYGIVIGFASGPYGYYDVDKSRSRNFDEFINFIQNLNSPTKISESFLNNNEVSRHLIFHQNWNHVRWMRHFNPLLSAINNQHCVTINFFSFRTETDEVLEDFMPYWMKQNAYFRWYVIGFTASDASFPTIIGCDKIRSISVDGRTFERNATQEKYRYAYENAFGVYIYDGRAPELVRIEVTRFQSAYIKSLPLHPSQEIESENDRTTIFRFKLVVNHEFAYELLRQNAWNFNPNMLDFPHPKVTAVKVLEPAWLVDYFHQTYKRAYLSYCDDPEVRLRLKNDVDIAQYPYPISEF